MVASIGHSREYDSFFKTDFRFGICGVECTLEIGFTEKIEKTYPEKPDTVDDVDAEEKKVFHKRDKGYDSFFKTDFRFWIYGVGCTLEIGFTIFLFFEDPEEIGLVGSPSDILDAYSTDEKYVFFKRDEEYDSFFKTDSRFGIYGVGCTLEIDRKSVV